MEILLFLVAVAGAIYFFRQHQTSQKARLAAEALARTLADEVSNLDSRLKASQSDLRTARDQVVNAQAEVAAARRRVDEAKPYLEVADTAAEAVRIRRRAQEDVDRAIAEGRVVAEAIVDEAKAEAKQKREAAARRLEELEQQARAAERQAGEIIEQAREKAMAIAGDAYKALENAESLKSVVQALQNRIEGYGDRYVAPTYSLLDELAGAYSFDEAGRALKAARDRTQRMVEDGLAADCEYVEKDRRETAIRFVIDAFNGKVDTILGRIKSDNYGTLRQEVLDAFALVNANGQAFRNARIQPAFRDSRLDELKFAEAVVALRDRDREEQRRIKEQIREEERAQREFERAQRDAANTKVRWPN